MNAMSNETTRIDCLGLRCPEPILTTARAARGLAATGGLLDISADDAAFPIDLKSWCRSTNAELVSLEERDRAYRAIVRVAPPAGGARVPASNPASTPKPQTPDATLLDYRGMRCPEPIVELAKAARQARGPLEILADDPAFPLDLKSWCRSAGATSEPLSAPSGLFRMRVYPKNVAREAFGPTLDALVDAAPVRPATPAPSVEPRLVQDTGPTASFDLCALDDEALDDELAQIGRLRPGTTVTLLVRPGTDQRALRWCTENGHELRAYSGGGRIDLVIGRRPAPTNAALVPSLPVPQGEYDCALLVMHNDLESLLGALLVANSAAAQGMRTMIFFTFWGLNLLRADRPNLLAPKEPVSFMQRVFKWLMPKGPRRQGLGQLNFGGMGASIMQGIMQKKRIQDLPALLAAAKEQNVRFMACTMSMEVMGITRRDLEPYENLELGGVATFVDAGRHAPLTLAF
jgi:TusA-related sulfurtransferase/peroxiredoxin family protein